MSAASTASRYKSWQRRRRRVSVLAQMALRRERIVERLVELRVARGLTQEQAAHRIQISNRQYQRWEAGESTPHPNNLDRIAESYEMSIDEFLGEAPSGSRDERLTELERRLAAVERRIGLDPA